MRFVLEVDATRRLGCLLNYFTKRLSMEGLTARADVVDGCFTDYQAVNTSKQ